MGVLLGGFIEARPRPARGRHVLPRVRRARPGRGARHADRGRRDDVPRHGHDQVAAGSTTRCSATPLELRDLVAAHLVFVAVPAGDDVRGLHAGAGAVRASSRPGGGRSWRSWPGAGRHGVRDAGLRLQRPAEVRGAGFGRAVPARACSRCSCSPARSSRSATSAPSASGSPGCTPLWHGVNLSRMFCRRQRRLVAGRGQRRRPGGAHRRRLVLVGLRPHEAAGLMTVDSS